MEKMIYPLRLEKNKYRKQTKFVITKSDIAGCLIFAAAIGWVLFQVVRAC